MEEKDGWKRVRATVPDYRIINRAARKSHKHSKIYVRGAHYEYLFEKVAGMKSIIYRRRLIHHKNIDRKRRLIKVGITLVILVIGIYLYFGTVDNKNAVNNTLENYVENSFIKDNTSIIEIWEESIVNKNIVNNTKYVINEKYEEYKEGQAEKRSVRVKTMEYEVVEIVNSIREEKGIRPLVWDDQLYHHSKKHSEELASKRKLFHSSMYESYAENCWGGEGLTSWDANDIVNGWMNSPGHRTWLLCPNLHHVGVGIVITDTGMYASWTFWRRETSVSDWR